MALNIDIVNSTVINVYETGGVPRSYFGAVGASGKFYPSGTSGNIPYLGWAIISDTTSGLQDSSYSDVPSTTNSNSGTPEPLFSIDVIAGVVTTIGGITNTISGYALGDLITIQGSDLGGSGELILKVTQLDIDGLLIVIGGDFYETKWYNLVVGETSPTSLSDAQSLLANLFSTL